MLYDITMIGHVCKDTVFDVGIRSESLGGAVYFSSAAASRSGKHVHVITKAAEQDDVLLNEMRQRGIAVTRQDSPQTTCMALHYDSADRERREILLAAQAPSFSIASFPPVESRIFHLAGLVKGEIPEDFIPHLAQKGDLAVDVQGFIRCNEGERLLFKPWENADDLLPFIKFLKTDAAEAEILTGEKDREKAAILLNRKGAKEVLITHNSEALLCVDGKIYTAPFTPSNLSGRTGRGDTTFAAYLARRVEDAHPAETLRYAAALCSIKMEHPGPFEGSISEVYARMKAMT